MTFLASLLAVAVGAAEPSPMDLLAGMQLINSTASATSMVELCRAMIPKDVVIKGHINRRSRRGTEKASYKDVLTRTSKGTDLKLTDKKGKDVPFKREGKIADTDVTWSDLTLDFLWWDDISFDVDSEGETVQGIICRVILLKKGTRAIRIWIDKRTGAMLQAHELSEGKVVREFFCTSIKKFGKRWAPRNIEVGPPGAKFRTKIVIDDVQ